MNDRKVIVTICSTESSNKFAVRVDSNSAKISVLISAGKLSMNYKKEISKNNNGETIQITAPRMLNVSVESDEEKIKINVALNVEIYSMYTRNEILEYISRLDERNLDKGETIKDIKIKTIEKNRIEVWILTSENRIIKDMIHFTKIEDLDFTPKEKLGYYTRKRDELFLKETDEEKIKKFNELSDAWIEREAKEELEREERFREDFLNS